MWRLPRHCAFVMLTCLLVMAVVACGPQLQIPESVDHQALAQTALAQGHLDLAVYHLHRLRIGTGWQTTQLEQASRLWRLRGDARRAGDHLWLSAQGDAILASQQLAELAIQQRRWSKALTYLEVVLRQQPGDGWANLQAGLILAPHDRLRALSHLRAVPVGTVYARVADTIASALLPSATAADLALNAGRALAQTSHYAQAEQAFIIAFAQSHRPALLGYAAVMRHLRGGDGQLMASAMLSLPTLDAEAWLALGILERLSGDLEKSAEHLQTALALQPDDPRIMLEMALITDLQADASAADAWLERAIAAGANAAELTTLRERFAGSGTTALFTLPGNPQD